jgi:isoleucyl-tRNA synthetase
VAEELNVKEVTFAASEEELAGWRAKPSFRLLGPRLGPRVKEVATALTADDGTLAATLAAGRPVTLDLEGGRVVLGPEEVELTRETRGGWGITSDGAVTVALDLSLTDELRAEGVARELVHAVQNLRKEAGLEITDRISLTLWTTDRDAARAIRTYERFMAGEVLAERLEVLEQGELAIADMQGIRSTRIDLGGARVGVLLRPVRPD